VSSPWESDGPQVHIEFLRISDHRKGRVTLVLDASAAAVTSLWARMTATDLATARESLRVREGVPTSNMARDIGVWCRGDTSPRLIPNLSEWSQSKRLNAVVYTNLGQNFRRDGQLPTAEEVAGYLRNLKGVIRDQAEEYVRKAPRQINTAYRRAIEAALSWTPPSDRSSD